jgi:CheY-like chemotaxis protein
MTDRGRPVLVVDDDPDILEVVGDILELYGVRFVTACDGVAALRALRDSTAFGLVLLDLRMPQMTGEEVLVEMRRDPLLAGVPVVVISGNYFARDEIASLGANDSLVKPLNINRLMTTVARFVDVPELANATRHAHER